MCLNNKSEKGCAHGDKCHFRHVEAEKSPAKSQRQVVRKISCDVEGVLKLGCVSQDSFPGKSILREPGMLGSKHAVKFSKFTWHQIKKSGKKGSIARNFQKCAPHERSPCAPKFGERSHEETLHQERCVRKAAWDLANIFTNSRIHTELRSILLLKRR